MTDSNPSPPRPKNPSAIDCALTLVVIIALLAFGIPAFSKATSDAPPADGHARVVEVIDREGSSELVLVDSNDREKKVAVSTEAAESVEPGEWVVVKHGSVDEDKL